MAAEHATGKTNTPGQGAEAFSKAQPPRAPESSAAREKLEAKRGEYLRVREAAERRSVLRGLVAIVLLLLIFAWLRAGTGRAFYTGWWQQW